MRGFLSLESARGSRLEARLAEGWRGSQKFPGVLRQKPIARQSGAGGESWLPGPLGSPTPLRYPPPDVLLLAPPDAAGRCVHRNQTDQPRLRSHLSCAQGSTVDRLATHETGLERLNRAFNSVAFLAPSFWDGYYLQMPTGLPSLPSQPHVRPQLWPEGQSLSALQRVTQVPGDSE